MNAHIGRAVVLDGVEWTIWSELPRPQCYWAFRTEQGGGVVYAVLTDRPETRGGDRAWRHAPDPVSSRR